jgi:hypothetical protein
MFCLDANDGVYGAFKRSCCVYPLVQQLVGHTKIQIVLKYAHSTQVQQAQSVKRMEQVCGGPADRGAIAETAEHPRE